MISIIQQPNKFTPVNNPIIFQFKSDNVTISFFTVQILDDNSNIIANLRLFTTPSNLTGTYTDLSSILYNTVNYQLLPSDNLVDLTPKVVQAYKLVITEKLYTGAGIIDGITYTTDIYYAWNGELDKIQFTNFRYSQYAVTAPAVNTSFLTNKPNLTYLNDSSTEYLSFLNDGVASSVQIKTYNGNLLATYNKSILLASPIYRIDVSPASLADEFDIDFSVVDYFTVQVMDSKGFGKTKLKCYKYRSTCQYKSPIEVIFLNRAGGFDSFTFYNVRESLNVTRTNIAMNDFTVDDNGNYTDNQNGVYNPETETINVNSVSAYKAITEPLTDDQSFWLKELIQSPKVFVKLSNGDYLPVQLNTLDYPVQQKKYNTSLIRLEIEFVANGDVINANDEISGSIPAKAIMLTAFSEFDYDTDVVYATTSYGDDKAFNATYESIKLGLGSGATKSDFIYMIQEDLGRIPTIADTVMWLNWFSPSTYNPATVRPYIQETTKESLNTGEWVSGGYNAEQVTVIPEALKGGGSSNDASFVKGAKYLQSLGYKVGIVPVISTADVTQDYGNYLDWRGYIFFDDLTVFNAWNTDYQNFIKWYIDLCYDNNINLNYIYVGSEFQCLLTANPQPSPGYQALKAANSGYTIPQNLSNTIKDKFIQSLADLAAYAKTKFPDSVVTYASNWSEYGYANNTFNLDALWINPNIDRIGIDWYFPLTEIHTNSARQLKNGITSGEYIDYYYTDYNQNEYTLSGTTGEGKSALPKVYINPAQGLKNVQGYLNSAHYVQPRAGYIADASPLIIDANNYNSIYDANSISGITGTVGISRKSGIVANDIGGMYPALNTTDTWITFTDAELAYANLPLIPTGQTVNQININVSFHLTAKNTDYDRLSLVGNAVDIQFNQQDVSNPYMLLNIPAASGGSYFATIGNISYNTDSTLSIQITNSSGNNYTILTNLNGTSNTFNFTTTANTVANFFKTNEVILGAYNIYGYSTMRGRIYKYEVAVKSINEYYGGVFNFEDTVQGVRNEWDYFKKFGLTKKVMATELGAGSYNGSSVNPNTFVTADYQSTAPALVEFPDGHNMKAWFDNLKNFNYYLKGLNGAYGSTYELDEDHQKVILETTIKYLDSVGITEQVIYTLSAKYSGSYGTTFFNDTSGRYELYTVDSPIYPLSHAINGKYSNGYTEGILNLTAPNIDLSTYVPLDYNAIPATSMPIGTASRNLNSYVNPDLTDMEYTFATPTGNTLANAITDVNGYAVINSGKTASGDTGRFVRFYAYGDGINKVQRIPATISFEAKGDGVIDVIVYSAYDYQIVGRQQFTLTNTFQIFSFQPDRFFPNSEYILGIYVNGKLAGANVTATFKKNLTLDMNTGLNLGSDYIRLRADYNTTIGSSQPATDWYGYDDNSETMVKKYYQSSAFSKLAFNTDADFGVIEYVRDFYNIEGKNAFNFLAVSNSKGLDASGNIVSGYTAISDYIEIEQLTQYALSGFGTTTPYYCWYDKYKSPVGIRTNLVTSVLKSPPGAAYLILMVQNTSDSYTVYTNGQVEAGTVATDFEAFEGQQYCDISGLSVYVNGGFYQYLSLEPQSIAKEIQQIRFDLPPGNNYVEVMSNGRGAYAPFDPLLRRSGTYLRSIYLPDTGATISTSAKTNNLLVIGDSIISGFKISTNPQKNVWVNAIKDYGFIGDVFHSSYAGLILNTHIGTTSGATQFANQMALYPNVSKIFIQGGINDAGNNVPLSAFTSYYSDFIGKLHTAVPAATIYCFGFTPSYFETNNIGVTYDQYRDVVQSVASGHTSYCKFIDFRDIYTATFDNIPDGIHPNDAGTAKLIQGLIDRSDIL